MQLQHDLDYNKVIALILGCIWCPVIREKLVKINSMKNHIKTEHKINFGNQLELIVFEILLHWWLFKTITKKIIFQLSFVLYVLHLI